MRHNWNYKTIGDVCTSVTDGSHNPPKGIDKSDYRMISSQNIFDDNLILTDDSVRYLSKENHIIEDKRTRLQKDVVLLTIVGTIGRACILTGNEGPLTLQRSVAALHPSEEILPRFLLHTLIGNRTTLNQEAHGIAQKGLYLKQLSALRIPVPTIEEQQKIVSELDKINELIRLKKEQLKDYDNLAQSIFYEMFGDEKYERRKLKDIVKVKSGQVSPLEDPYCDMVHVGPANIESNTGRLINLKTAKEENLISGKYLFDSSMVLYSKIRPNLNKVTIADFEGICSADMYPLIPSKSIDKKFLLFILKQKEFLSYAIANSGRANIPKINREALLEYSTILPPLSLQLQFAERLALIEQQKAEIQSTISDLETLLASRMQYWFD